MKNLVTIFDGMGNQMFHYALALAVRKEEKTELNDYLAGIYSNYGPCLFPAFGIEIKNHYFSNMLVWFVRKCVVFSLKEHFSLITVPLINLMGVFGIRIITDYPVKMKENRLFNPFLKVYCGRFQNEKYFRSYQTEIKQTFAFDINKVSERTRQMVKQITDENSISIHVRRGDYLSKNNLALFENICTIAYYNKTIDFILARVEDPVFYVFSDDIPWTKENFQLPNAYFIDWNSGVQSWEDMFLMSLCKHNIIANSTFSWWGAWLNEHENKIVLCPPKYTNEEDADDLFPDTWQKIYT